MKVIYQFLYPSNGYLFFRCFEKVFEEERNENRERNSRCVKLVAVERRQENKDWNDKILGFELVFVG